MKYFKIRNKQKLLDALTSAHHLLVEVGHHLLEGSVSGLVCFAELLQDLQRKRDAEIKKGET